MHGRITDEALAELRGRVGVPRKQNPWNRVATRDAIWHFAEGVGDDNPLWLDEDYARRSPYGTIVAPPTFVYTAANGPVGPGEDRLGLPGVLGLWYRDTWELREPVRLDDTMEAVQDYVRVDEIATEYGGRAVEQAMETTFRNGHGAVVARYWRSLRRFERAAARERGMYAEMPAARYTEAEMRVIYDQYAREKAQRRGAVPRYWEDVREGEPLITLVKGPLTVTNLVAFLMGWGSPMCPANRLAYEYLQAHPSDLVVDPETNIPDTIEAPHWDSYFARESGLPAGYDFGAQRTAWFAHLMTDWLGDHGRLRRLDVRLRRPNLIGDTTWLSGRVARTYVDEGLYLVDVDLWSDNQRGERSAIGQATASLPTR
jgi:acyl dehydratase